MRVLSTKGSNCPADGVRNFERHLVGAVGRRRRSAPRVVQYDYHRHGQCDCCVQIFALIVVGVTSHCLGGPHVLIYASQLAEIHENPQLHLRMKTLYSSRIRNNITRTLQMRSDNRV